MPAWIVPAVSAGMGILGEALQGGKDKRQIEQQKKLNQLQVNSQMELNQKNMELQKQMWEHTNYGGQKAQMLKAGLNPALMYGMSGGGGVTTGSAGGSVTGAQAPSGSGSEIENMTSMGLGLASQIGLQEAQRKNIEADTKLKEADAAKTGGVDTELGKKQIESLTAGITNTEATTALTKAKERMQNLENELTGRTLEDQIETINYTTKRACQEAQQAVNNTDVSDATIQEKKQIIKAEAVGALLRNALTKAQTAGTKATTEKTQADTRLSGQAYEQNITKMVMEWQKLSNTDRELRIKENIARGGYEDASDDVLKLVSEAVDGILRIK